ncbi:hypothetical protein SSYIS1_05820 [Serratia symbiotica]|uniref:Uncharacterized protein n=1 Tax=Serratia symbiotica TaxID=138074 RepID=A0A455VE18_9GAMM|nr:hypothetical protein SSYIS1_05820 [Serratia symbiotica]
MVLILTVWRVKVKSMAPLVAKWRPVFVKMIRIVPVAFTSQVALAKMCRT